MSTSKSGSGKRGRDAYWDPLTASIPPNTVPDEEPAVAKTIRNFVTFCTAHNLEIGPEAIIPYGRSQRHAGLDASVVANNLQVIRFTTAHNWEQAIAQAHVSHYIGSLRTEKARGGGPKRKPLLSLPQLMSPISELDLGDKKDGFYAAMWLILIITGIRPTELFTAQFTIESDGIGVRFNGRKNSTATSARFWKYLYEWSYKPSDMELRTIAKAIDSDGRVMSLKDNGEPFAIAQGINAWLKKIGKSTIDGLEITSTSPRVFLDNVLSRLFESGAMPMQLFEDLMGHTIKVSRANYQR